MTNEELTHLLLNKGYIGTTRDNIKVLFNKRIESGDYIYSVVSSVNKFEIPRGCNVWFSTPINYFLSGEDDWDIVSAEPPPEGFEFEHIDPEDDEDF